MLAPVSPRGSPVIWGPPDPEERTTSTAGPAHGGANQTRGAWSRRGPGWRRRPTRRVRPADPRDRQDLLLHRLPGAGVFVERGQGRRTTDRYDMAAAVPGGHAGYHLAAGARPEGELHRGAVVDRAAHDAWLDRVEAVDDRHDAGHLGRIGDRECVVELLPAGVGIVVELLPAGVGIGAEHRGHGHHPGVGWDPPGGRLDGVPDGQPDRDAGEAREEVQDAAPVGPGRREDVRHGTGTGPRHSGLRLLPNRYLVTAMDIRLRRPVQGGPLMAAR